MTSGAPPRVVPVWALLVVGALSTAGFLWLTALGWGGVRPLLAHPARATMTGAILLMTFAAAFSGFDASTGRREAAGSRRDFVPFLLLTLAVGWLPAYSDRRDLATIDGDAVRWLGVVLAVAGGALRIWPMFVLGRRFSPFVAVQEGHELCTDGPYRRVRNPSYLGALIFLVGWPLVFRSALGLALVLPAVWLVVRRIHVEEALLASEFGDRWTAYRARTWRLVPFVH